MVGDLRRLQVYIDVSFLETWSLAAFRRPDSTVHADCFRQAAANAPECRQAWIDNAACSHLYDGEGN